MYKRQREGTERGREGEKPPGRNVDDCFARKASVARYNWHVSHIYAFALQQHTSTPLKKCAAKKMCTRNTQIHIDIENKKIVTYCVEKQRGTG